jgi:hypothetical protein
MLLMSNSSLYTGIGYSNMQFSLPCILHKAVGNGSFRIDALFSFPFLYMEREKPRALISKNMSVGIVCVVIPQVYYTPQEDQKVYYVYTVL